MNREELKAIIREEILNEASGPDITDINKQFNRSIIELDELVITMKQFSTPSQEFKKTLRVVDKLAKSLNKEFPVADAPEFDPN